MAFENLFLQNFLAVNDGLGLGYKMYYYRTSTGIEVDFVAYGKRGIKAFEVKRAGRVSSNVLRGLKHFSKEYPESDCFLVYGGKREMREGNIRIIPIIYALKNLSKLLV